MLNELLRLWLSWVEHWGYLGIFVLMALESSIVPVPSEIVIPPAAYWAAQGKMSFAGVIFAGTAGSFVGSALSYWISLWIGLPLIERFGKYILISPQKIEDAQSWIKKFGAPGVFFARLLPVIRHLVSIPAGVLRMPFGKFTLATTVGAGIWCSVLAWFGQEVLGSNPELLQSPEAMHAVMKAKLHLIVAGVLGLAVLYAVMVKISSSLRREQTV